MSRYLDIDKLPADKLEAMFVIQDKLRELFGVPKKSYDTKEGQAIIREMGHNTIEEICEALNILKNHPWTKDEKKMDRQHYKEEVGDTILFLVEWLILSHLDADQIFDIFIKIAEKNFFRISTKY
jgi:hypothetical protein